MLKFLTAVAVALVVDVVVVAILVRRIQQEHALAGRFGETERERALGRRAVATIEGIESLLNDNAFLRDARRSVSVRISHVRGRVHEWDFANGGRWRVRHRRASGSARLCGRRAQESAQRPIVVDINTAAGRRRRLRIRTPTPRVDHE